MVYIIVNKFFNFDKKSPIQLLLFHFLSKMSGTYLLTGSAGTTTGFFIVFLVSVNFPFTLF